MLDIEDIAVSKRLLVTASRLLGPAAAKLLPIMRSMNRFGSNCLFTTAHRACGRGVVIAVEGAGYCA